MKRNTNEFMWHDEAYRGEFDAAPEFGRGFCGRVP